MPNAIPSFHTGHVLLASRACLAGFAAGAPPVDGGKAVSHRRDLDYSGRTHDSLRSPHALEIDERLAELGITLPDAPAPAANYVP